MVSTYDFIIQLRAIRDYKPEPLSNDDLGAILEAGRWTGSSKNQQSWSFVAVTDRKRLEGLAEHGDFTQPVRDSSATIVLVKEPGGNMFDIGRAAQNMMLAAKAVGVASCPITFHRGKDAAAYLGIGDGAVASYGVALGYPADDAKPRKFGGRKPAQDVVRLDVG
jgi:nitroreductase